MPTLLPCGERAFLVELPSLDAVLALDRRLREALRVEPWGREVEDVVPAARTLMVAVHEPGALRAVREAVAPVAADVARAADAPLGASGGAGTVVEIPVVYDGPDLDDVAAHTGLSVDEVVAAHTGTPWRVGFGGFAPGFAYLVDGDPRMEVPRRSSPRTSVPPGSVALAGTFSAVYPRASPGGWQLIGRTNLALWDVSRTPPALLQPGDLVRFVVSGADVPPPVEESGDQDTPTHQGHPGLVVTRSGPQTLVQDSGRPGWKHVGVGRSGAADLGALGLANRLVGNQPDAAGLEVTFGGLTVVATASLCVAVTGAQAPASVNGRAVEHASRIYLTAGDVLALGMPTVGLRSYLAVSGGLASRVVLGSRSTDTMAGLGPAKVTTGDVLAVGPSARLPALEAYTPMPPRIGEVIEVDVLPGPRDAWVGGLDALLEGAWTVTPECDRIGVRLTGEPLTRAAAFEGRELPSEGVMRGAIQVPANGLPVLFLNDHPVTGGYPVVGVLTEASSDRVAQARPGQPLRFRLAKGVPPT